MRINLMVEVEEGQGEYCIRVGEQVRFVEACVTPGVVAEMAGELLAVQVKHMLLNPDETPSESPPYNRHEWMARYLIDKMSEDELKATIGNCESWINGISAWLKANPKGQHGNIRGLADFKALKELLEAFLPDDSEDGDLLDEQNTAYSRMIGESLDKYTR